MSDDARFLLCYALNKKEEKKNMEHKKGNNGKTKKHTKKNKNMINLWLMNRKHPSLE